MVSVAPFGSWKSTIDAEALTVGSVGLDGGWVDGDRIYWLQSLPSEGGRTSVWRLDPDGSRIDLTPNLNVRSRVHEYGGGAWAVRDGTVVVSDFTTNAVFVVAADAEPRRLNAGGAMRYAAFAFVPGRRQVMAVREDHTESDIDCVNTLVTLDLDAADDPGSVFASGADFYGPPAAGPDGRVAWVEWDHPNMPWDSTRLLVGPLDRLSEPTVVEAGPALMAPTWDTSGRVVYLSDESGYWNFRRWDGTESASLHEHPYDFGEPAWTMAPAGYAHLGPDRIGCTWFVDGIQRVGELARGELSEFSTPAVVVRPGAQSGRCVAYLGFPDRPAGLYVLDWAKRTTTLLKAATELALPPEAVSVARAIEVQTDKGVVHGWFYPPTNSDFAAPKGELPPVVVLSHGGPTALSTPSFSLSTQYWTSRGFGILDVNYSGSSGFGRAYRQRLNGAWGVADVHDCVAAARELVNLGLADRKRLIIRGGSAGGYTTLRALTTTKTFAAGISLYGIGDLIALAEETHKFESRYLDGLIAPYPAGKAVYLDRSPISHLDALNCPMLILQGADDKVVPPDQAEAMAAAVRAKGLPVALVVYDGEGHGFRKAETIRASLAAAQSFLGQVFGFTPADDLPALSIENLS